MTPDARRLVLTVIDDIRTLESDEWNRLADVPGVSPFLEHAFLASFEASGCAAPDTGWHPRHFLLRENDAEGSLIAAAPAYAKTHSMGEFVFDQGLAQAAVEMGRDYYPKLVATLPFTPSPGYRFLMRPEEDGFELTRILLTAMGEWAKAAGLHSVSVLFADPGWTDLPAVLDDGRTRTTIGSRLSASPGDGPDSSEDDIPEAPQAGAAEPWLRWAHQYFLWENPGYRDFDDYLARFNKNQRRNIRRERRSIVEAGIRIESCWADEAPEALMDRMFEFYVSTNDRFGPWAAFFLNREWFRDIARRWKGRIRIFTARVEGEDDPVGMSLLVHRHPILVGRYWGASRYIPNLHFELCYYAPIEYAISESVPFFDPGMGSPHKARRGFGSREFSSWHRFFDRETSWLFASVLPEANLAEQEAIARLNGSVPWASLNGFPTETHGKLTID